MSTSSQKSVYAHWMTAGLAIACVAYLGHRAAEREQVEVQVREWKHVQEDYAFDTGKQLAGNFAERDSESAGAQGASMIAPPGPVSTGEQRRDQTVPSIAFASDVGHPKVKWNSQTEFTGVAVASFDQASIGQNSAAATGQASGMISGPRITALPDDFNSQRLRASLIPAADPLGAVASKKGLNRLNASAAVAARSSQVPQGNERYPLVRSREVVAAPVPMELFQNSGTVQTVRREPAARSENQPTAAGASHDFGFKAADEIVPNVAQDSTWQSESRLVAVAGPHGRQTAQSKLLRVENPRVSPVLSGKPAIVMPPAISPGITEAAVHPRRQRDTNSSEANPSEIDSHKVNSKTLIENGQWENEESPSGVRLASGLAGDAIDPSLPNRSLPATENLPATLLGAENFKLAAQPRLGDRWKDGRPQTDSKVWLVDPIESDFSPTPIRPELAYDAASQMEVYEGKTLNANQRPLVELGRPWYQLGQLSPGYSWFGKHNNVTPQFLVYGDVRTAVASNTQNGDNVSQIAFQANLDFDLKLTGTERWHMFVSPLGDGVNNNRWLLGEDRFVEEYDADIDFGYFEGDLGAIVGGLTNRTLPFDLPFAVGVIPLLMQNGVWMEDAFLGAAATIPARNSPRFNISNMDVTFFAGFDKINTDAFRGDDSAGRMYGMASFIEAMNGYFEIDYAFLEDRTFEDRSYHNFGFGFTRRFGRLLSNSTRLIVNAGQSTDVVENSADGILLLSENSLITGAPSTLVPYMNFFAGFDRPQSAARAGIAGGVLRNTGILFESDNLTNYPTLDPTANDTYGGALGLNLIADDFSQQLVVEMAMLGVMGEDAVRNAAGPQYGLGFRYQLPLSNAVIFRADGMYGFLEDNQDVRGLRFEMRHKY